MTRVHFICEGQTEEMFVEHVLSDTLFAKGIYVVPSLIGTPGHKGGNVSFDRLLRDVSNRLLRERQSWCTTFFDFYGLPENFPGKAEAIKKGSTIEKADILLRTMSEKLREKIGDDAMRRFIPYVQMYEFEALLFSDPAGLASGIYRPDLHDAIQKIREEFETPEHINNSSQTAPSKRIEKLYRGYQKPIHGSLAAIEIGLTTIRTACPGFNSWLTRIEELRT